MKYTVDWSPTAEQELAALWLDSGRRQEVTRAANLLDDLLRVDAHERGESRAGRTRIMFEAPLAVLFHVTQQEAKVLVAHVWSPRRKKT